MTKPKTIAVVGNGIAGLQTAYALRLELQKLPFKTCVHWYGKGIYGPGAAFNIKGHPSLKLNVPPKDHLVHFDDEDAYLRYIEQNRLSPGEAVARRSFGMCSHAISSQILTPENSSPVQIQKREMMIRAIKENGRGISLQANKTHISYDHAVLALGHIMPPDAEQDRLAETAYFLRQPYDIPQKNQEALRDALTHANALRPVDVFLVGQGAGAMDGICRWRAAAKEMGFDPDLIRFTIVSRDAAHERYHLSSPGKVTVAERLRRIRESEPVLYETWRHGSGTVIQENLDLLNYLHDNGLLHYHSESVNYSEIKTGVNPHKPFKGPKWIESAQFVVNCAPHRRQICSSTGQMDHPLLEDMREKELAVVNSNTGLLSINSDLTLLNAQGEPGHISATGPLVTSLYGVQTFARLADIIAKQVSKKIMTLQL